MTAYEVAVEKNKNEPETYVKMARIWNSSGKYELAIEKLENAVKLDANNALVYKELYESYIKSRNFSKVIPVLEKYVALAGDDIGAKVRLVKFLCFQAKDYERAIEEGNKIIKTNPEQYTINRWLAWSYAETNRAQESFNANKQLFDTAGKNPEIKLYASDYEYFGKASAKLKKWTQRNGPTRKSWSKIVQDNWMSMEFWPRHIMIIRTMLMRKNIMLPKTT